MDKQQTLSWSEIAKAPDRAGIYAWYFRPELTDHDINNLIESIEINSDKASVEIRSFFAERLFKYFMQRPYEVQISGQLKPKYYGKIEHKQDITDGLIERIKENPRRLFSIRDLLQKSAPMFASPLYVGMSSSIKQRVMQHVNFIKKYKESTSNAFTRLSDDEIDIDEKSFAQRVVERGIPSSRLFLVYQTTDTELDIQVDVENILNRIYYPTLGRN
jgi:asparagine synthetase B (glutamine-hydrolysing)